MLAQWVLTIERLQKSTSSSHINLGHWSGLLCSIESGIQAPFIFSIIIWVVSFIPIGMFSKEDLSKICSLLVVRENICRNIYAQCWKPWEWKRCTVLPFIFPSWQWSHIAMSSSKNWVRSASAAKYSPWLCGEIRHRTAFLGNQGRRNLGGQPAFPATATSYSALACTTVLSTAQRQTVVYPGFCDYE